MTLGLEVSVEQGNGFLVMQQRAAFQSLGMSQFKVMSLYGFLFPEDSGAFEFGQRGKTAV